MKRFILFLAAAIMLPLAAMSQGNTWSQSAACPGWNNPTSFTGWTDGGLGWGGYSGSGGVKSRSLCPNVMTGETGLYSMGPDYTAAEMNTLTSTSCGYPSLAIPDRDKPFAIMTDLTGYDPNTVNHLRYVPTQFNTNGEEVNTNITKSIRVGDGTAGCNPNTFDAQVLNYDMKVNPHNALLYLYYAIVAQAPSHGMAGNPTFIMRVMKKNASGEWQQISDTMACYISSTSTYIAQSGLSCANMTNITPEINFNTNGWHQVSISGVSSGSTVYYKDWSKVVINLSNYLYDTVRVQVLIHDCSAEFHFGYAYIAGECRPMILSANEEPSGIATLKAPKDMISYDWSVSRFGVSDPVDELKPGGANSHYSFRPLASGTNNEYQVQQSDFQVLYRTLTPGSHDSVAVADSMGLSQTYRCRMVSAIDPNKPIHSTLYINVARPTIDPSSQGVSVYTEGNAIVVGGSDGHVVTLYDDYGNVRDTGTTPVRFQNLTSGTYHVKVGILPARMKVVVQ